jgi:hypothetical protein
MFHSYSWFHHHTELVGKYIAFGEMPVKYENNGFRPARKLCKSLGFCTYEEHAGFNFVSATQHIQTLSFHVSIESTTCRPVAKQYLFLRL